MADCICAAARNTSSLRSRRQTGFTLLEVMVALTIAGLALGSLFGVIAGNKRLAWRSEEVLVKSTQIRSLINFAQLQDERGEVTLDFVNRDLLLRNRIELEMNEPERKTAPSLYALRGFEIEDGDGETVASGSYWIQLDLPE